MMKKIMITLFCLLFITTPLVVLAKGKRSHRQKKVPTTQVVIPQAPVSAPAPAETNVTTPPVAQPPLIKNVRALWVWGEVWQIVFSQSEQDAFFAFAHAPHGDTTARINRIYLNTEGFVFSETYYTEPLRKFLRRAHDVGIAVEWLAGDATWARPTAQQPAFDRINKIIAFNSAQTDGRERFDGIHLDVEPYLLAEWKQNTTQGTDAFSDVLQQGYLSLLQQTKDTIRASGQPIILSADIPSWYSTGVEDLFLPLTRSTTPVDYLTIMNYFDTEATFLYGYDSQNIAGGVGPNLANNVSAIPMVFGAETQQLVTPNVTFYEEGREHMEYVFDRATTVFGNQAAFAGTAVHYYLPYSMLKR